MISEKCAEVYKELLAKGFQEGLCREIAYKYVNTDYTATRMLGYLYRRSDPTEEEVVDEMIAILSDRDRIVQKHRLEEAQAAMNQVIREGLPGRNDEDE